MASRANLLEGNINRQVISLAFPLLIGNIIQQFYNTVDSIIVGRYVGEAAFAALGISGTIMNLFIFIIGGCCTGVSIIIASFYGASDETSLKKEIFLAFVMGTTFALFLSFAGILSIDSILAMLKTPTELAVLCSEYLKIIFGGIICTWFYNLFSALMRATGNTKTALIFLIIAMVCNVFLDLLFVITFNMGIAGAALATVIAQLISAILCFVYINKTSEMLKIKTEHRVFDTFLAKRTINYALVSAMHQSSLYIGKMLVQGAVNSMSLAAISAYAATTKIEGISLAFGDSGAEAISVFVAQNYGGGNKKRGFKGFKNGCVMLTIIGILLIGLIYVFAPSLIRFFLPQTGEETILQGVNYLRIISFFYCFAFIGSAFVGFYRGSGNVNIPFFGTTMHISIRVILTYALAASFNLSAVAIGTGVGWICVVTFQCIVYHFVKKRESLV